MTHADPTLGEWLRALPVFVGDFPVFDPQTAPADPTDLFVDWLRHAVGTGEPEPHAMTVSTVDGAGMPDARVLLLKDLADGRWWFAINAASAKGTQLAAAPQAALSFHWKSLGRQVRVRGSVEVADPAANAKDFHARTLGSRIAALAGPQSQPLADLDTYRKAVADARDRVENAPDTMLETWRMYGVVPQTIEFWQGEQTRQHIRLAYHRESNGWSRTLLWP